MLPLGFGVVLRSATRVLGLDDVAAGAEVTEDNGQVTINDDPTANDTVTALPIRATVFTGTPGPRHCRGGVMVQLDLPPPPPATANPQERMTEAKCYNMPETAGCANFVANKGDGCEARLFAEPGCRLYMNTAVFVPEERAVGGLWRSMAVQCGIPEPDPDTLGSPPLAGLLRSAKMKPKAGG
ncbi:hypothetical protein B0H67DRAFT_602930 [Lasiosphaeris hirsuta]|uniref:Uncharacterized protein n=1 Tax=Lasiosphaeris hirsuta TaxID=260670 RepID=A0AA40A1L3_9PEZI|nr:hypothetical protein B0H67DRAFT_602930 [Lasiosphaeris hirsuta]